MQKDENRASLSSMVTSLLTILLLSYLGFAALLYFTQDGMLYLRDLPSREVEITPSAMGLEFESVAIETEDGERLDGWYLPSNSARGTLIFFHGNAGNISHRLDSLDIFHQLNLNVLIFDYRGYGRSTGSPSEQGTYLDARAVWDYLVGQRGVNADEILLFGRSMGGAIATQLATQVPAAGLIVESSFSSVPDMGAELYPWLPVRLLARLRYDSKKIIGSVKAPVLIIHSQQDEIIPFHHGQALYEAATEPKSFLKIMGDHNGGFLRSREFYQQGIKDFLDQVFDLGK